MEHPEKKSRRNNKTERHPPHLKGKQIGLFYAKKGKAKNAASGEAPPKKDYFKKCVGTIMFSESKKYNIKALLALTNVKVLKSNDGKYGNIEESAFKKNFMASVQGSINEKLEDSKFGIRDERLDEEFYTEFCEKRYNKKYMEMQSKREKLPAFEQKEEIVTAINENQVIVISGETGCGKTTQVAQFILDEHLKQKNGSLCHIYCTQPRRISAFSVAARVADERGESLGKSVGYQIRLEGKLPRKKGSIIFCTTGVLIKRMQTDPSLKEVSHLILDEIHERDVISDFLITLLKRVIKKRKNLKVILMSATLNSNKFAEYYDDCKMLHIPGFTFPVEEFYLEDVIQKTRYQFPECRYKTNEDIKQYSHFIEPFVRKLEKQRMYSRDVCNQLRNPMCEEIDLDLIMTLIMHICRKEPDKGAILVFLTGYSEISKLYKMMESSGDFPQNRFLINPLHSQLPTVEQRSIFVTPPEGTRKIILSTNIAETSITIDDVVFVIDCGKIKVTHLQIETNSESLIAGWVSLANAHQRKGRAGRVKPGICYHLFSKARLELLHKYQVPEILRKRLEDVILSIKILQLGNAKEFLDSLMDNPHEKAIQNAVDLLNRLNALDENENLTPLGYHLACLPMNPQLGKMILLGAIFSCLDPVLTIAASLDFKDPFYLPMGKEKMADKKKMDLSNGWKSDHLLMIEAMKQFEAAGPYAKQFCWQNFLSPSTLTLLQKMKQQFADYLYEMKFLKDRNPKSPFSNCNSDNLSLVKAVVCGGLYPNVVLKRQHGRRNKFSGNNLTTVNNEMVKFHPHSILLQHESFESHLFVYFRRMRSSADYLFDASMVHPLPLVFFGDMFQHQKDETGFSFISINGRIKFKCSESTSELIAELRNKLNWLLEYKVSHPGFINWKVTNDETNLLQPIMELITIEDLEEYDIEDFDDD